MRRKFVSVMFILFISYLGWQAAACADDSVRTSKSGSPASSAHQKVVQRGTLYRVTYRGHTSYLFGTVHVGKSAFYPLEPQVTRALNQADKLVIEVDIRDAEAFRQAVVRYGLYPAGQTVLQHLSADTVQKLEDALQHAHIPLENVLRMQPWMIANLLLVREMARNGFPSEQGLEMHFLAVAKKQNKAVGELETADYQLSLFSHLSDAQQEDYLRENMADLADGSAMKTGLALIAAWSRTDSKEMERLQQEDHSATGILMQQLLIDQRNPGMADKIETLLKNDSKTFVAVGALHLIGDKSVPQLLQQRGYKVQKLY